MRIAILFMLMLVFHAGASDYIGTLEKEGVDVQRFRDLDMLSDDTEYQNQYDELIALARSAQSALALLNDSLAYADMLDLSTNASIMYHEAYVEWKQGNFEGVLDISADALAEVEDASGPLYGEVRGQVAFLEAQYNVSTGLLEMLDPAETATLVHVRSELGFLNRSFVQLSAMQHHREYALQHGINSSLFMGIEQEAEYYVSEGDYTRVAELSARSLAAFEDAAYVTDALSRIQSPQKEEIEELLSQGRISLARRRAERILSEAEETYIQQSLLQAARGGGNWFSAHYRTLLGFLGICVLLAFLVYRPVHAKYIDVRKTRLDNDEQSVLASIKDLQGAYYIRHELPKRRYDSMLRTYQTRLTHLRQERRLLDERYH